MMFVLVEEKLEIGNASLIVYKTTPATYSGYIRYMNDTGFSYIKHLPFSFVTTKEAMDTLKLMEGIYEYSKS